MAARDVVLLFPGQGSQKVGMGADLAAADPRARAVFEAADAALDIPLSRLCFEGPDDELMRTENAQPALLTHGAAAWAVVSTVLRPSVRAAAGHSLGEFTAHHAAGALSLADALQLVRRRGEVMAMSGAKRPGGMAAILGADEEVVEAACRKASDSGVVVPANYNAPDQLVISGEVEAVERAMGLARDSGAKRAIRLKVSGAFHSPLMAVAADGLEAALSAASFGLPAFPIYANVSAEPVSEPATARRLLLEQLVSPVRWTGTIRALTAMYPEALYVELGPGVVLSNLVKRIASGTETAACGTATDVDALLARFS
ncbi:MAG TPA: ACP S-malonyltransferase [Gemmatimonadaceae bacterium]|nr:ACP S-malonyltransferase [Gemmatimonadaceae bacterium]